MFFIRKFLFFGGGGGGGGGGRGGVGLVKFSVYLNRRVFMMANVGIKIHVAA